MFKKQVKEAEVASTSVWYDGEVTLSGSVQIRKCTKEMDSDGKQIGEIQYHRHVCHPGDDYSDEPEEVQAICKKEHTAELIQARKELVAAREAELNG
jgi:predicted amidohydrolase